MLQIVSQAHAFARRKRGTAALVTSALLMLGLAGCASVDFEKLGPGEALTVLGPQVRTNRTPLEPAFACMAREIQGSPQRPLTIAVGDVRDYTGKYDINEGNAITQGGSLMVYSALGKLDGTVQIADRYNTDVAQMELNFLNQRQLGDGKAHTLEESGKPGKPVPWLPYYGGSIIQSDYYITGGITELNYNVQSGGVQLQINQLGPKARVYTENIGIDLQIVNTKTLIVEKTVSLSKQITGYEVGFNIFRFFGSNLYDLDIGNKSQEPIQLGVRSTLEDGVLRLVSSVAHVPYDPCAAQVSEWIPKQTAAQLLKADTSSGASAGASNSTASTAAPVVTPIGSPANNGGQGSVTSSAPTLNKKTEAPPLQNGLMNKTDGGFRVVFDYGADQVTGADLAEIDRVAQSARQQTVQIQLLARANESWAPSKRASLTAERVESLRQALRTRGVMNFKLLWEPDPTQAGAAMDGAGYQNVAIVAVGP